MAQPQEGSLAFQSWFGTSKVVDRYGRPLKVYHGSKSPWVVSFGLEFEGRGIHGGGEKRGGIWFTSSKENARFYADYAPKKKADKSLTFIYGNKGEYYASISDRNEKSIFQAGPYPTEREAQVGGDVEADRYNGAIRKDTFVVPVFLSIQNPLVLDGVVPRDAEFKAAVDAGHDGIVAKNVLDGAFYSDVYVAFSPNQIKHATDNSGAFDPARESIFENPPDICNPIDYMKSNPPSKPKKIAAALDVFERVKSFVIERLSDDTMHAVKLLHCGDVTKGAPKGQRERSYAHVGHFPDTICAELIKFAELPLEHQVGILLHEFGHVGAPFAGESGADEWVFVELGIALEYKGELNLQWVSANDINKFGI